MFIKLIKNVYKAHKLRKNKIVKNEKGDILKLIGIVGRAYYNKDNQRVFQVNEALRRILVEYEDVSVIVVLPMGKNDYLEIEMGADKIEEFDQKRLDFVLDKCDGFIVPGGSFWYSFDEYVMRYAICNNKPLLGICAGFQALCGMYAKNRYSFDMTRRFEDDAHYGAANEYCHQNIVLENTRLQEILGKRSFWVNSVHHDYIDFELEKLVVSCYSEDGIIEGVELPGDNFVMGVQWHPEYLQDRDSMRIFDCFVGSIREAE